MLCPALNRSVSAAMASIAVLSYAPSYSLADPAGSDPLVAAVGWLQGTLLGTVATTIAIIAVAVIGMMMLNGRINWRSGATVITGCFILFGAGIIAAGIRSAASGGYERDYVPPAPYVAPPPPVVTPSPAPTRPADFDPYAGAAPRNF
ncbi:TrbC/VIRB2 family protein [Sphingomonas alpina]|uniref:TrbC/VIRB2 family protein n=1 Tax=Sphingomonas alpina TaxID=653931 RepID=A0A7H0LQ66_9SPHN|nr:TrbC/VIRB2 family protein [Sphingomonas alpina]